MRTTAASPPGRCTVLPRMTWSYCSHTQRREQRSGEPISRSNASAVAMGRRHIGRLHDRRLGRVHVWPIIERRLVAQFFDRQIGHDLAAVAHDEPLGRRGRPDHRKIEAPFPEDRLGLALFLRPEHHEHALLAFGQHHLVSAHAGPRGRVPRRERA